MRWRIGLLQDAAALERQAQKDAAKDAAKKKQSNAPTVKTEAETKAEEEAASKAAEQDHESEKPRPKPKIRPLTDAKAIETGANFISETFLFSVAAGLILFETWRSRRKESTRRDGVKDRLDDLEESERAARKALIELERELLEIRARHPEDNTSVRRRILPKEIYEQPAEDNTADIDDVSKSWYTRIASYISSKGGEIQTPNNAETAVGPAEKIIVESEKALDVRRRQHEAEDAAMEASGTSKNKSATTKPSPNA